MAVPLKEAPQLELAELLEEMQEETMTELKEEEKMYAEQPKKPRAKKK